MVKRRRLSPGASSAASSSPALAQAAADVPSNPASPPDAPAAGAPPSAGSSRLASSVTPAPGAVSAPHHAERGVGAYLVPGSGDGWAAGGSGDDECFLWQDLPMNKNGFRYAFCAPSPDPSPSARHPFYRLAPPPFPCAPVHLSHTDRSAFLRLSAGAACATADRGFRSARANVAVREGTWYYEAVLERSDGAAGAGKGSMGAPGAGGGGGGGGGGGAEGNPHVRVGWARREAGLDAPVGVDAYSYGIRDVAGERVHLSRPKPYAAQALKTGDVVGCLITLPARAPQEYSVLDDEQAGDDPGAVRRMRIPIKWKGQDYFEMAEFAAAREMEALVDREGKGVAPAPEADEPAPAAAPSKKTKKQPRAKQPAKAAPARPAVRRPTRLAGSSVRFFLNGADLGEAFDDLFDFAPLLPLPPPKRGELDARHDDGSLGYYPMVSCFGRGRVRVNFGPAWERPPEVGAAWPAHTRAMCDRLPEFAAEERARDEADEAAARVRLEREREREERDAADAADAERARPAPAPRGKKKRKGTATPAPSTPGPGTPREADDAGDGVKAEDERRRRATSEAEAAAEAGGRAGSAATSARASSAAPDAGADGADGVDEAVKAEQVDEAEPIQW